MQWQVFPTPVPPRLSGLWIAGIVLKCTGLPFVLQLEAAVNEVCNALPHLRRNVKADWAVVWAMIDEVDGDADDITIDAIAALVWYMEDCYRAVEKAMMEIIGGAPVKWLSVCKAGSIEAGTFALNGVQHEQTSDCIITIAQHTPLGIQALLSTMRRVQSVVVPFCRALNTLNRGIKYAYPVYHCTLTARRTALLLAKRINNTRRVLPVARNSALDYLSSMEESILHTRSGRAAARAHFNNMFPTLNFEHALRLISASNNPGAVAFCTRHTPRGLLHHKQNKVSRMQLIAAFRPHAP